MTQKHQLDQKGSFINYPLAELLVEIAHARFSGSMRVFREQQKAVIYFDEGKVVFAVSNSKPLRLFNVMLQHKKIDRQTLSNFPNFANDLEFSLSLQNEGGFSKTDVDAMFTLQIDAIIVDALSWPDGEWHFSPLARLRDDVRYETNVDQVLMDYARCVPGETVLKRFRSVNESFSMSAHGLNGHVLQAHEAYVLERFKNMTLNIAQLRGMCTLPESGMLQALYVLWLGGILVRRDWNAAFTPVKIGEILTAKIKKVKSAEDVELEKKAPAPEETVVEREVEPAPVMKAAEIDLSLVDYLKRIDASETHYDILGLSPDAEITEIKQMYFGLAKLFHPDKFHREKTETQKRVQAAFTELAHAYETLKDNKARDDYNFKMRKEIEAREQRIREGGTADGRPDNKKDVALQSFEQALVCLKKDDYEQAVVLLGRSVHYSPENAQYHAFYGQALSAFEGQDHKAEAEFQAAVKLAPKDAKIRMMLVEFLLEIDMKKRAIGELNRFLEIVPGNKDALKKLEKLTKVIG